MAPRRSTSAETAARFLALRGGHTLPRREPLTDLDRALAAEAAKQRRLRIARQAVAALTWSEFEEFLAECIELHGMPPLEANHG